MLYTATCAEPGSGKSTVHRYLSAPVYAWEVDEQERLGTEAEQALAKTETLEVSLRFAKE